MNSPHDVNSLIALYLSRGKSEEEAIHLANHDILRVPDKSGVIPVLKWDEEVEDGQ